MAEAIDLEECSREPIHIPGAIQPHGVLIGLLEPGLEVAVCSANVGDIFAEPEAMFGRPVNEFFDDDSVTRLQRALEADPRDANPLALTTHDGRNAHGLVHRSDGLLIIEVEPVGDDQLTFTAAYRRLVRRFDRVRRAESVEEVCDTAVHEIRRLTGFDRVMVYRFDPKGSGKVIAEEVDEDAHESYLGLHYPASDIPPQARKLYVENPVRIIVDAAYRPVPLVPDKNPLTGGPIDLSHAVLRSVSPVHCEYLQNMGVHCSMSVSLVTGDALWGLIACHHYAPRHIPYGTRIVAEFLAHVLSARVAEFERVHALTKKTAAYAIQSRLIDEMVSSPRFQDGLAGEQTKLTDLIECDGAAVLFRGEITSLGRSPGDAFIYELGAALSKRLPGGVVATDHLADWFGRAGEITETASGLIAVPISNDAADYLFWFRGERMRTVTWAGDPSKAATRSGNEARLGPRHSFEAWVQEVRGHSRPWAEWEVEIASDFRTALAASVIHQAAELERLNTRLIEAGRQKDQFLATVSHELRNPLNAIMGWVRLARMGLEGQELEHALETIENNAQAQTELIDDLLDVNRVQGGRLELETKPLNLTETVGTALETVEPTALARSIRIVRRLDHEDTDILGDVRRLQQVVWNLLTNAIKFSPDDTTIEVTLAREESEVVLTVSDEGAGIEPELLPHVFEPFRQASGSAQRTGLGLGLSIVKSIVELHGGRISAVSEGPGTGSTFQVHFPVAAISAAEQDGAAAVPASMLDGMHVLVAEDHPDAARMLGALLQGAGAEVSIATDGVEALEILRDGKPVDAVVSDLDMPNMNGFELLAEMLDDDMLRAVPAVALTAYTRGGDRAKTLTSGFRHHVAKPVDAGELLAVLSSVVARANPAD